MVHGRTGDLRVSSGSAVVGIPFFPTPPGASASEPPAGFFDRDVASVLLESPLLGAHLPEFSSLEGAVGVGAVSGEDSRQARPGRQRPGKKLGRHAREHTQMSGMADRCPQLPVGKGHPLFGEGVEVGRCDFIVSQKTVFGPADIIADNHDDVGRKTTGRCARGAYRPLADGCSCSKTLPSLNPPELRCRLDFGWRRTEGESKKQRAREEYHSLMVTGFVRAKVGPELWQGNRVSPTFRRFTEGQDSALPTC